MAKVFVYQIYLFCFRGRSVSPIAAATKHLKYVEELGATHVWIGPVFASPWADHGYDISDHFKIEPQFGTMQEFDTFVAEAHQRGLKVIIDFVPNHISIEHHFFKDPELRKKFCYLSKEDHPGQRNLFDGGSAWEYLPEEDQYYCHLFTPGQADLKWQQERGINLELVSYFHDVIDFWTMKHNVNGFRIDVPQSINKDFAAEEWSFEEMLFGDFSTEVLNALFCYGGKDRFLIMECFDPTTGELVEHYIKNTPVDFVLNVLVKDEMTFGKAPSYRDHNNFVLKLAKLARIPGFMLDLESHDSARFPSRGIRPKIALQWMFQAHLQGVCLYNGQELGLDNPTQSELPDELMLDLDAMTAMRYGIGESLAALRPISRANARAPLPGDEEYERQKKDPDSPYIFTKCIAKYWKTWDQKTW